MKLNHYANLSGTISELCLSTGITVTESCVAAKGEESVWSLLFEKTRLTLVNALSIGVSVFASFPDCLDSTTLLLVLVQGNQITWSPTSSRSGLQWSTAEEEQNKTVSRPNIRFHKLMRLSRHAAAHR